MNYEQFSQKLKAALPVEMVLPNPGGGTSTIKPYTSTDLVYRRKKSTISVPIARLYEAYEKFRGKAVSSRDLREFDPEIFDSQERAPQQKRGHSCNCTMFFLALKAMGIVSVIEGPGKPYHPFWVTIPAEKR